MLSTNKEKFSYCRIPAWHEAGYTGRGIKVAVFEDTDRGHGRSVADIVRQVLPEAEVLGRPRPGPIETSGDRLTPNTRMRLEAFYNGLVAEGVNIVVQSLGGCGAREIRDLEKELLVDRDVVLFTSAGNESGEISSRTSAALDTWIAVGACVLISGKPRRVDYSNYGAALDVAGFTNLATTWGGNFPGTSCANPFVAGLCGLWFQWHLEHYGRTPNQAETLEFIRQYSEDLGELGRDDMHGFGLLRLPDPATLPKKEESKMLKVCLDPGHGGSDPGAVGPSGLKEKDVNLAVALRVAEHLRRHGMQVKLTREDDRDVSLAERCKISDDFGADVFLSVHCNSADNPAAHGTEAWYCTSNGLFVARKVQEALVKEIGRTDRGCKSMGFYVLKNTRAPAALTELAFISNSEEEKLLASADFRERAARGCAKGILAYLGVAWQEPPATPQPEPTKSTPARTTLRLKVGGKEIIRSDGKKFPLFLPARVEGGHTMVELRPLMEAAGHVVNYDGLTQEITVLLD